MVVLCNRFAKRVKSGIRKEGFDVTRQILLGSRATGEERGAEKEEEEQEEKTLKRGRPSVLLARERRTCAAREAGTRLAI